MPRKPVELLWQCHFCQRPITEIQPVRTEAGWIFHRDCPYVLDGILVPDEPDEEDW